MWLREKRKLLREYVRYFINNGISAEARRRFAPDLIRKAREFKYLHWPQEFESRVKGRDVLDVGCGMGLHCVGFTVSGVRTYTGCDPRLQLDSSQFTNLDLREKQSCGWTPRRVMERFPHVLYVPGTVADLPANRQWDVAVLHNTSEHLIDIAGVLEALRERLRPDGLLIFRHHNFYAWNGHHLAPYKISQINGDASEQWKVLDWNHISREPEPGSYIATNLNRLRLDEVRAVTERYYDIDEWRESLSSESEGLLRLTDPILQRHPHLTRRDLETQSVYCVARARPAIAATEAGRL